jgi:tetratricopeptide (TPR) repeat protein
MLYCKKSIKRSNNLHKKLGQINRAFAMFDEAVRINPWSFDSFLERGILNYQIGNLDESLTYLNKALEMYSTPRGLFYKAKVHASQNLTESALGAYLYSYYMQLTYQL